MSAGAMMTTVGAVAGAMTGRALRGALLMLAAALLTGCPTTYPPPADYSDDPARLLAAVERRAAAVQRLSGELSIEVWQGDERVRLTQLIAVDEKGRVRIDALSPFGQPLSTLVSDGSRLMIYSLEDKTFRVGAATPENLARLLPVAIEPEALSALLRGAVPIMAHERAAVSWNARGNAYRLELERPGRMQQVEFEPEALRVVALRMLDGGALRYRVRFGDYSGAGDAVIPRRIRFEVPDEALRIDMSVVDYTVNPDLPEAAFQLEAPRGVRVEAL